MKHALLLALATPSLAFAAPGLVPGTVACLTLQDAKSYQNYQSNAPSFAEDLLARADCYAIKEATNAVPLGKPEQGFQAFKLLSGHRVWLPMAQ